jgi:haloalkane dehalogenase
MASGERISQAVRQRGPRRNLDRAMREFCRSWKNQTEVTVSGVHFIQEDSGPAIGCAITQWIRASGV